MRSAIYWMHEKGRQRVAKVWNFHETVPIETNKLVEAKCRNSRHDENENVIFWSMRKRNERIKVENEIEKLLPNEAKMFESFCWSHAIDRIVHSI